MLEDDVERLTEENYEYAKELYTFEKVINSLSDQLIGLQFEGQKSSEENYQACQRASKLVYQRGHPLCQNGKETD